MVFDVSRSVGVQTTRGFEARRRSNEITLLPEAALALQQRLGVEAFSVLLILACVAEETPQGLVVDDAADIVREQTGWGRQKVSRTITELADAALVSRTQERIPSPGGKLVFGPTRVWLAPPLYQRVPLTALPYPADAPSVDRKPVTAKSALPHSVGPDRVSGVSGGALSVDGDRVTAKSGDGPSVVGIGNSGVSGVPPSDVADPATGRSADGPHDNSGVTAGQTASVGSVSGQVRQHHEDENEDDHSSRTPDDVPADDLAALRVGVSLPVVTADDVPSLTDRQLVELLQGWNVMDADKMVRVTARRVLIEAIAATLARAGQVASPGAYVRQLVRTAQVATPTPPRVSPAPRPVAAPVVDALSAAQLEAALSSLPPTVRTEVEVEARALADAAPWAKLPQLREGYYRAKVTEALVERGVLAPGG